MELRTLVNLTFEPDASAVHLDDLTRNLQTKAPGNGAIRATAGACSPPLTSGKHPVVEVGRHATALVLDGYFHVIRARPAGHQDLAPRGRVFRCIAQQY